MFNYDRFLLQHLSTGARVLQPVTFLTGAQIGKRVKETNFQVRINFLAAFYYSPSLQVAVIAFELVHADISHEDGVSGREKRMPITEHVIVSPHFIEVIMREGLWVGRQCGKVLLIEASYLDSSRADIAATVAAG